MKIIAAVLFAAFGLLLAVLPAAAADRALLEIIGYSKDAHYFAFEEYGVLNGTGRPYSTIYVIDLGDDDFVPGSPFRAKADDDDDDATLAGIRALAARKAAPTIKRLRITEPGDIWVTVGDGLPKADGKAISWATPKCCRPPGATGTEVSGLALTTFPLEADEDSQCGESATSPTVGFAVSYTAGGQTTEIHRDKVLPESRGCTIDYRFYAIVAPFRSNDGLVAIVSSYPTRLGGSDESGDSSTSDDSGGSGGPGRRFVAVPLNR